MKQLIILILFFSTIFGAFKLSVSGSGSSTVTPTYTNEKFGIKGNFGYENKYVDITFSGRYLSDDSLSEIGLFHEIGIRAYIKTNRKIAKFYLLGSYENSEIAEYSNRVMVGPGVKLVFIDRLLFIEEFSISLIPFYNTFQYYGDLRAHTITPSFRSKVSLEFSDLLKLKSIAYYKVSFPTISHIIISENTLKLQITKIFGLSGGYTHYREFYQQWKVIDNRFSIGAYIKR